MGDHIYYYTKQISLKRGKGNKKMSEFKKIQEKLKEHFETMSKDADFIYAVDTEKNELWDIYLNSFPEGTNDIYRERREHDCSCCKQFINAMGGVVGITNGEVISIWDFELNHDAYGPVAKALAKHVKEKLIKDVFISKFKSIGTKENHEDDNGNIVTWNHFHLDLLPKFVNTSSDSIETVKAKYRDIKDVFKRSLEEISEESVLTVLELISQNSLYKGAEWKTVLENFHKYQKEYKTLNGEERDVYLWDKATSVGGVIGKIKNHSIGTLLVNVSKNMDLDIAVKKYEVIVAPTNYKRPKPLYTKKMLEDAKKKLEELGFMDSLQRRFAILEDVNVNNVLFVNRDVEKKLQSRDVFDELEKDVKFNPKTFSKVEEVPVNDFIENILPTIKNMEIFVEGRHATNMVSLIAPYKADSKTMFKWDNNFSWAYSGNIADSDIKKNVKSAGGRVDGVLRFSIQWNDEREHNKDDYDAHCMEPCGNKIFYASKTNRNTTGELDIDIINPTRNVPAVENITWTRKDKMGKGTYKFLVHNYTHMGGQGGFKAEIEFNGQQYNFDYPHPLKQNEKVQVAEVTFDGENFTIKEKLPSQMSSREIWNVKSNNFVPVSIMMYSPNYWNEQKGIGNKHFFFMLKGCINEETPNGFFNEYLNNELTKHRKVFEALGSKMKVDDADGQLSGLGFSSTQKNSIVVRVEGNTKRVLKIKF